MATGAMVGAAVIGAGSSIYSANKQASAAEEAADTQAAAQRRAMELQLPFAKFGKEQMGEYEASLDELGRLTRGEQDITQMGGYEQIMQEGQRAIESSAASRGMLGSGPTLAELPRASLQARDQVLGELRNLAGMRGQMVDLGARAAGAAGGFQAQAGQTQAQGILGQGQIRGAAPGQAVSAGLSSGMGAMRMYNMANQGGGGATTTNQPTSVAGNVPNESM